MEDAHCGQCKAHMEAHSKDGFLNSLLYPESCDWCAKHAEQVAAETSWWPFGLATGSQ